MPAINECAVSSPGLILVIEDHDALREELVEHLTTIGHRVIGMGSPLDLDAVLMRERVDLLVLDLNLPFEDGLSVARRVRDAMPGVGIIALSGRSRSEQKAEAYDDGVDIFLAKPAMPNELAAAIKSLSRRLGIVAPKTWTLNLSEGRLVAPDGGSVALTSAEMALLRAMALSPNRMLDSAEADLLEIGTKRALESSISRLRMKLAPMLKGQQSIKVIWGKGYQLMLPVVIAKH